MASFPSSPLGEPGHPASGSSPVPPKAPPPAPVDAADPLGEHISTLGSGASPGRPEVPPPDAVPPTPQGRGAYQVPAPEDLPPQPDRPFADAENRPHVERAVEREPTKARRVPQPPQPVEDSAIVRDHHDHGGAGPGRAPPRTSRPSPARPGRSSPRPPRSGRRRAATDPARMNRKWWCGAVVAPARPALGVRASAVATGPTFPPFHHPIPKTRDTSVGCGSCDPRSPVVTSPDCGER